MSTNRLVKLFAATLRRPKKKQAARWKTSFRICTAVAILFSASVPFAHSAFAQSNPTARYSSPRGLANRASFAREEKKFSDDDYRKHIDKLKKRMPEGNFHIRIQKPFVVIGDESPDRVRSRSIGTIKWSVDKLKKDYFKKDPLHIIDIWLFKNKTSYEKNCLKLFGSRPTTPYGFYSSENKALVMNISTGGGTLVHEIVHPFIESNFPKCPSWFNEGLASLYEQCREENGKIWGLTNWRLRGLQIHIKDKKVPTFQTLTSTSRYEFYREDPGTNYSQARYLCYYLQQKGKLRTFYHEFVKNVGQDPTGYKTLKKVLAIDDFAKFQKSWESYVMDLRF